MPVKGFIGVASLMLLYAGGNYTSITVLINTVWHRDRLAINIVSIVAGPDGAINPLIRSLAKHNLNEQALFGENWTKVGRDVFAFPAADGTNTLVWLAYEVNDGDSAVWTPVNFNGQILSGGKATDWTNIRISFNIAIPAPQAAHPLPPEASAVL